MHEPDGTLKFYRFDALENAACRENETGATCIYFDDLMLDAKVHVDGAGQQTVSIEDEEEVVEALQAGELSAQQQQRINDFRRIVLSTPHIWTKAVDEAVEAAIASCERVS